MLKKRRVVVFGIFDGVHEGHRALFRQAKTKGADLVAIVGRDAMSIRLKGRAPRLSEASRLALVQREADVDGAVLGDAEPSQYKVLRDLAPDVVCFGYDQDRLSRDFERWRRENRWEIEVHTLLPFEPEVYHTSLLRSKKKR